MDLSRAWPEWQAVEKLGEGSYGKVYRCISEKGGVKKESAIKVISVPQNESEQYSLRSEGMTDDTIKNYFYDIVQAFTNEIHVMKALQGTKSIVSVEDYKVVERKGEIGWDIYIRMELLKSFNSYAQEQKIGETEVAKLGKDICIALEECEKRKILHRDIKPENIFVDNEGNFKIGDFGVARQLENSSTTMSQKGTYNYMAPEVVYKKKGDCRADIYSLGMVMYKLLNNNREPFVDPDKQMIRYKERVEAVEKRLNGEKLPKPKYAREEMANVILKACEFDKENRYATAAEFRQAIEKVVPTESVKKKAKANGVSGKIRLFMRMNRTKLAISALSLLLVACIVGGSVAAARYRGNKNDLLNTNVEDLSSQTTENQTDSRKTDAKKEVKYLDAETSDQFIELIEIMNTVSYLKGFYDYDIGEYDYNEYDCSNDDIYEKIAKDYFACRIPLIYKFLFGDSKFRTYWCESTPDPHNKFESYYTKIAEAEMETIVEKVFNLDIEKLLKTTTLKDCWYFYDGYYYCDAPSNVMESTVTLDYLSHSKTDENKYLVQIGVLGKDDKDELIPIATMNVECSYLEYDGIRFWSIYKTSNKEVLPNKVKIWRNGYADQLSKILNDKNLSKKKPYFELIKLDYDDIPELVVGYADDGFEKSIYTVYDDKIVYLGDYLFDAYDTESGRFAFYVCAPMPEFYLYEMSYNKVNTLRTGSHDLPVSEKYYIDNKQVSLDEFQEKSDEFLSEYNTFKTYDESYEHEINQESIDWVRKNAMLGELVAL